MQLWKAVENSTAFSFVKPASEIFVQIFDYIAELDAFYPTEETRGLVDQLKISEWSWIEWIGRYFAFDNDYGEHWFDNWPQREKLEGRAEQLGYHHEMLLVIDAERFSNGEDGPCHSMEERKQFWTDVLRNLKLSLQTFFNEARKCVEEENEDGISRDEIDAVLQSILNKYNSQPS